jgi:hypothetical protein
MIFALAGIGAHGSYLADRNWPATYPMKFLSAPLPVFVLACGLTL